jgi:4-alpha-glucanotransferase
MASICTGENPTTEPIPSVVTRHDGLFNHADLWKGAGVAVPVFSLRSKQSVGVGEFRDVKALVDMCEAAGEQHTLSSLPFLSFARAHTHAHAQKASINA